MKGDSSHSHSQPSKRLLLFDRRYGWIVDDWKHPAEEALAGGRAMFCVLPMAKSLINLSSSLVNFGLNSATRFLMKSNQTSTAESNSDKSNWFSEIEKLGVTADIKLLSSKNDTDTI
ncbi:hypothetical protein LUZ62_083459 [Rhynchospora pubera]|uniref:Uncharacterized protein n=1 Tax=Rhynchospora pubera TaxID=906938 RepID=A0AAV8C0U2_9POAL|nr:hypothetical protein LUZ62_083459 [Rhynchospora pubera]